ncbi:MAG: L,D-transpeptidase family protein [Proteobacteria bacterium]|nr:L,D-transpeptidase family protein [Pseudomonadota bacterium]
MNVSIKHRFKFLLLIFCIGLQYQPVSAADLLSKATSNRGLSVHSEGLLIKAIENIKNNNTEKAIKDLESLIKVNPDFKAAQIMYADMILARSQQITDFGNISNASFEHISALRDEVQARWNYYKSPADRDKIPSSLIQINTKQEHILVVDSSRSRLFLFKNQDSVPILIKDFYVTIGKNGTGKYVEGDQKTPVGVYFVTGFINPDELPDLYGDGAFPIDYPNVWDQRHGRTGYGIWLHGTPSSTYSRPPKDSNGCVIVSNNDLNALSAFIDEGHTPMIITDTINWISKKEWKKRQADYRVLVEKWRKDWESKDVNLYLSHYSKEYSGLGKDYKSWVKYKRRVNPSKKFIKVNLSNTSMFLYPGEEQQLLVVTFIQDYVSDNFKRRFTKRQYWRMEKDGQWRIIYEGVVS